MAITVPATKAVKAEALPEDNRNISEIWNDAVIQYNKIAGEEEGPDIAILTVRTQRNLQAIRDFGDKEMQKFNSWKDEGYKRAKVRKLFHKSINFIEAGSKQLVAVASTSFPPAVAIGMALSFVLSAFRARKADFDVVSNFFDDMNNFLDRVVLLENGLPRQTAFTNALMDVFTDLLSLCAIARKYILKGKFSMFGSIPKF